MAVATLSPAATVVRVPLALLTAASTPWPAILVGVAVVVAVCLWLLFRSGSMADRARADHPEDDAAPLADEEPGQASSGGL
jgi:hypothetical protein